MSPELAAVVLIGGLILLLAFGAEIAVAMGIMAAIGLLFVVEQPLRQFGFTAFEFMNSFTLSAVPLFVFMGALFSNTGIIASLFRGADKLLGSLPGSVACSVLGANAIFGAISGSSLAACATFGKIAFPDMERLGYNPGLALGSIAIGGTLSVLIPPSIILIAYGGWEELSVARLFAGGMIPGFLLASLLMLTVIVQVKLNPSLAPKPPKYTWRERFSAIGDIAPFLAVIVLVLGTIFGGIVTPTESASLGAFLSVVLALMYRKMTLVAFKESMWTAVKIMSMIAFISITAKVLSIVFQYIGVTDAFGVFMLNLPFGRYGIFAVICVMYLVLGMFFDSFAMLFLTLPFVSPLIIQLGFDPIWFGVVYVVLAEIGLVAPPFGLNLFVLHGVVPKHGVMTIAIGALPFLIPALLVVVLLTVFPQLVLWLPSVLY